MLINHSVTGTSTITLSSEYSRKFSILSSNGCCTQRKIFSAPINNNNGFQCLLGQGRNVKVVEKGQHTIGLNSRELRSSTPIIQNLLSLNLCLCMHTYRPRSHQCTHVKTCSEPRNIAILRVVFKNPTVTLVANNQKRHYITATSALLNISNITDR